MRPSESLKIVIHLQRRRDGGLRAWSDDVPGLALSHQDAERVVADIIPAVETIMTEVLGYAVHASELVPARRVLHARSGRRRLRNGLRRLFADRFLHGDEAREYAAAPCAV